MKKQGVVVAKQLRNHVGEFKPKVIFAYSQKGKELIFNQSLLHPYKLNPLLEIGDRTPPDYPSLRVGCQKFTPKVFSDRESRISNMLKTILEYERNNPVKEELEIYCHNGLFSDIILRTKDKYDVILYKNKFIFAGTETRRGQNKLINYIGLKFEAMLTGQESPKDTSHCKLLLEGNVGKFPYKSVVEVDSYKMSGSEKKYAEMKLVFCPKTTEEELSVTRTNFELLSYLRKKVFNFDQKMKKWLFQCHFGLQEKLIIGIRNEDFELMGMREFDFQHDIVPYVREDMRGTYEQYLESIDTLEERLAYIYRQITFTQSEETQVYRFSCTNFRVKPHGRQFNRVLIPQYTKSHPAK